MEVDKDVALEWFLKAAKQGFRDAIFMAEHLLLMKRLEETRQSNSKKNQNK